MAESVDDEENELGQTALHVAVINNDLGLVELLLSRGADVDRKTRSIRDGYVVAESSCECANTSYCLHVADEFGNEMRDDAQSALHLAAKHSSEEVLRLLIEKTKNVDETSGEGSTALHYATQNSLEEDSDRCAMELLLQSGANVNARNRQGKTPLYLAAKFEKLELVAYLLSKGADVNICTTKRSTPLHCAIINCNLALARLLLDSGASMDVENERGEAPLFYNLRVVPKGEARMALVELLLARGVSPERRNRHSSTALHVAVQERDCSLARLMIARGCALDAKDRFDMSPLAVAVCTNLHSLAELLLDEGADANAQVGSSSVLEHAIIRRNEAMVGLLLRGGAEPSCRAVAAACAHKSTRIMQMLIEHGADLNYRDAQGRTPLMRAIREPNYAMMRHLLQRGARLNERDCHGNTAFHLLFDNSSHTKENLIEYLLEHGADFNLENDHGHTPLQYMMLKCFTKGEVHIFVRHLALRLAQAHHVNPKISRQIESDRTWLDYFQSCVAELARMREARILDKCSYFDLLTRRHSALGALFQEDNALVEFELGMRTNSLCNYSNMLRRCFHRKSKRSRLLKSGVEVMLNDVFRGIFPLEIVDKLCDYLSNEDLTRLL